VGPWGPSKQDDLHYEIDDVFEDRLLRGTDQHDGIRQYGKKKTRNDPFRAKRQMLDVPGLQEQMSDEKDCVVMFVDVVGTD
jgi:hypothetical protein